MTSPWHLAGGMNVPELVIRQALMLVAVGLGLGLAGSFAFTYISKRSLRRHRETDGTGGPNLDATL